MTAAAALLLAATLACSAGDPAAAPDPAHGPPTGPSVLAPAESTRPMVPVPSTVADPATGAAGPSLAVADGAAPADGFSVVLGRPSATTVAVSVLAAADAQLRVAYGPAGGALDRRSEPVALRAGVPVPVELRDLRPDTGYRYQVQLDGAGQGTHEFHTARPSGSTFTFTIDADPHFDDPKFNATMYRTTLANAVADQPDFHVNLGDTFMTEKGKPATEAAAAVGFSGMRPYLGIIGAEAPLYLVNGNHEGELGWLLPNATTRQLPLWSTTLRQAYYPTPVPGSFYRGGAALDRYTGAARDAYYAWSWGDAQFIVLDPFWYTADKPRTGGGDVNWGWTLGREQYDWLRSTLETSRATQTFVFIHHLVGGASEARGGVEVAGLYEWGGRNTDGSDGFAQHRPGWGVPIHQLLVQHHVTAVFHGHDHVYVAQELDGIAYQEVPQPSVTDGSSRLAAGYGYTSGVALGSSGHLRVTVTPAGSTVQYVRAVVAGSDKGAQANNQKNGQVDHAYALSAR